MAEPLIPHFHLSGINGITTFLFIVVAFGTAHLLAASMPDNAIARAWVSLGF